MLINNGYIERSILARRFGDNQGISFLPNLRLCQVMARFVPEAQDESIPSAGYVQPYSIAMKDVERHPVFLIGL